MKLKVFTVYDVKIGAYAKPFLMITKGEALRGWLDVVNDPSTNFNKHPEDYTLFEIGEWDDQTAMFTNERVPIPIGPALEYINSRSVSTAQKRMNEMNTAEGNS